jgi:uncharacterized membrane protein
LSSRQKPMTLLSAPASSFAPCGTAGSRALSKLVTEVLVLLVGSASAQTQASCQFVKFNTRFFVNNGHRVLDPRGVNDNGTVVGDADDDVDFSVRGFTRLPNGSITYYGHNSLDTYFMDRSNSAITVGVAGPPFSLGTTAGTPFLLKSSRFTPLTMRIGGTTYKKFTVWAINKWGTTVGAFTDSSGKRHGFKRFSDGNAIALDFPGAVQTEAFAINDNGAIVGYYSKTPSPNLSRHGFIYNNDQWATLDYPNSTVQTELTGISDSSLIIGTTIKGSNAIGSFLYKNGTFKKIVMPNSNVPTYANGVSPGKDLITGFPGYKGFIATCK